MKNFNYYPFIVLGSFLFWFLESWYFGFNEKAVLPQEKICDMIAGLSFGWGILGDLLRARPMQNIINLNGFKGSLTEHDF